jgi:long-chain acyl-CoA synthetase
MATFVDSLRRAERVARHSEAVVCGDVRVTYAELMARCRRLIGGLAQLGTGRGDRVAVLAFNSIPYVELYCSISGCARVQVPLNIRWAEPELAYALEDAGARVLFTDRDPGRLSTLVDRVVRLDLGEYDDLLGGSDEVDFDETLTADDLAGLFYTGGTTGTSKGVMLTHGNLVANAWHMQMTMPMTPTDTALVHAPMFHAAGTMSVLQSISVGARQVVMPAFEPAGLLDLLEAEQATVLLTVPTMLAATVEEQLTRPRQTASLRLLGHGGSPVALEVVRRARRAFPGVHMMHLYGATETAPLVTGLTHEERWIDTPRARSCGQAVIGVDMAIRHPDGSLCADGDVGEVTVRGPNVTVGYWNKPEHTAAALRHGWYWTGDLGRVDGDGYLYLLDRSKDMIITGAENVYCTEVEDAIYSHPMVLEAAVFGIPDERWGEVVHAVVVPRGAVTAEEIIEHCRDRIAGYKVPNSVDLRDEPLPKSGPGKVLKRELREPYWRGRAEHIA